MTLSWSGQTSSPDVPEPHPELGRYEHLKRAIELAPGLAAGGPIKTFPLRGIKDTPPYLHDGRLLMKDDTVEYFNLTLDRKLAEQEKKDRDYHRDAR